MAGEQLNTPQSIKKRNKTRATTLSPKQKAFAQQYVANKMNGTKAVLATYETTDPNTAGVIANDNLSKPKIKAEIEALLRQNDVELAEIIGIHKRNMVQDINYPTSQKAVDSFYEILGMKSGDKPTNNVQVAFIIEK